MYTYLSWLLRSGPVSFPFIGSAIQLAYQARSLKHFEFFGKLCQKYGPVVKVKAGVLDIGLYFFPIILNMEMERVSSKN